MIMQDSWPRLAGLAESKTQCAAMQKRHTELVRMLEQGCAVLRPLMTQVAEAACDDPAVLILPHLVLPLVRECLEAYAKVSKVLNLCLW